MTGLWKGAEPRSSTINPNFSIFPRTYRRTPASITSTKGADDDTLYPRTDMTSRHQAPAHHARLDRVFSWAVCTKICTKTVRNGAK
jgi:hypothetical protein